MLPAATGWGGGAQPVFPPAHADRPDGFVKDRQALVELRVVCGPAEASADHLTARARGLRQQARLERGGGDTLLARSPSANARPQARPRPRTDRGAGKQNQRSR